MKSLITILLITTITTLSYAQSKQDKELIKQIDRVANDNYKNFAPGCAILVAKQGQVIYEKGLGLANLELNTPMKPGMVFRVGSITKQFTAVAILQLMEKGQLALNDSIQKFISGFHFKGKTITIENLLTHTSGITGYDKLDAGIPNAIRVDFKTRTIIDSLDRLPLEFDPGTRFSYSNSNYFLLGYIIEKQSGKTYPQYLKENIFDPAGLNSTFYDSQTALIPDRSGGYAYADGKYQNAGFISMSLVYSAGALVSTVGDLYKWHLALYNGKLIKKESLAKATTAFRLADGKPSEYGYGFFIKNVNGANLIGHGGAIDGFRAMEAYYPEQDIFIACLLNSEKDNDVQFFQLISNKVIGEKAGSQNQEIRVSDELLNNYIGTYKNEKYNVSINVYRVGNHLYGDLSNGTGSYMKFVALTEKTFELPDIKRVPTTAEFVTENGKITKLILTQEQPADFIRVQ